MRYFLFAAALLLLPTTAEPQSIALYGPVAAGDDCGPMSDSGGTNFRCHIVFFITGVFP